MDSGNYTISSFTSKGGFSSSVLAASRVPKVTLASVNTGNAGNKFGVYTREAPKSFKRSDVLKGYKLTPVVTLPADIEPFGGDDFEVRVM